MFRSQSLTPMPNHFEVRGIRARRSFVEAEVAKDREAVRLEVRDWVDLIHASDRLQPLGYLAWAACGKDPGFSPGGILEHAARSTSYSAGEVLALAFATEPPDPADLSRRWHAMPWPTRSWSCATAWGSSTAPPRASSTSRKIRTRAR